MAEYNTNAYKNKKRRESRSKIREAIFVHEYVETKYLHIYEEAGKLYNTLNEAYPAKPDLRRTEEFRSWKNSIALDRSAPVTPIPRQKYRKYMHPPHRNIPLPYNVDHTSNLIVLPDERDENSVPSERDENSVPRAEVQISPSTPESPQTELNSHKVMQLRIPLLSPGKKNPDSVQTSVEMPSKILESVTDEVIQESTDILHPTLLDEIPAEVIDKIISELRQEPELMDIVAGIEERIEVEEVGLDIDIPDLDDPLQDELENIFW